jgi:two-component system sensor histidine kinase/response regulator
MQPDLHAASHAAGRARVLVVDDVAANRFLYRAVLEDDGHDVTEALDGMGALTALQQAAFDLVLLDVSMPGMDGIEVLQRIREAADGGPAVLILTAAAREPAAIERGLAHGADAYLTKPVENRELAARVRAAIQIHRLRRELAALRRDQTAMLVHDLRHPLTNLSMLAEVIESEGLQGEERRNAAGLIRRMVDDLGRLVDTVLTASRLEAGVFTVEPRPVALGELVAPSIEVFRPLAQRRRVTLEVAPLPKLLVVADPARLRQVIDNLLSNAVKFSPREATVRIAASVRGGLVEVTVTDQGPGVAPADRAVIFDRYRQTATGRSRGGAGLGLAIAAGIVHAHGGSIRCGEPAQGGADFTFTLPLARRPSTPSRARTRGSEDPGPGGQ